MQVHVFNVVFCFLKILFVFRERGRKREKERETLMYERQTDWLPFARPQLGT